MKQRVLAVLIATLCLAPLLLAQTGKPPKKFRRAEPPKAVTDTSNIFFDDVFAKVVGSRPGNLNAPATVASGGATKPAGNSPGTAATATPTPAASGSGWAAIISNTAIEDEVKAIKLGVDQAVTTPTSFRSRDYKSCRRYFSILAMLFGIIEEYEGDVRWKAESPALRDVFARSAGNCKTASDQTYKEAKLRQQELQDVVGGSAPSLGEPKPRENWENFVDRAPLMQHLEASVQTKLQPAVANAGAFKDAAESVLHEAQMVAAMSEVLKKPGMADADDDEYKAFAESMKQAALSIVEAAKAGDHEKASKAVGAINQACTECHGAYRG